MKYALNNGKFECQLSQVNYLAGDGVMTARFSTLKLKLTHNRHTEHMQTLQ